jgi:hypothetical protein
MKWFPELRMLAFLRRIARALEESNELQRTRLKMEFPAWRERPKPRKVEISVPTAAQWNERHRREHDAPS